MVKVNTAVLVCGG